MEVVGREGAEGTGLLVPETVTILPSSVRQRSFGQQSGYFLLRLTEVLRQPCFASRIGHLPADMVSVNDRHERDLTINSPK